MPLTLEEARVIASRESFVVAPPYRAEVTVQKNEDIVLVMHEPQSEYSLTWKVTIAKDTWANGHLAWFAQATRKMWLDMYYGASGSRAQTASR